MFFDKIFGVKEKQVLSYIGTDVHSHLIPGIDDGAKDYETSLACIAEMQRQGINKIYVTPHFQKYRFNNDEDDVVERFEKLKQLVAENNIDVSLNIAGEYLIDDGFREKINSGKKLLTLKDNYLLVEFSFNQSMFGIEELFFDVQMKGYEVILAHPERYSYLNKNSKLLANLKEQGIYFQSNVLSFGGFYGSEPMRLAYQYVENGWIDFLGTDIHGLRYRDALINTCKNSKFVKMIKKQKFLNNQL